MKKQTIHIALGLVLLGALLLASAALAAPDQTIDWYVIGGGGGDRESVDGVYTLDGTIGQPVAGVVNDDLCSGFWCWLAELEFTIRNYLPIILRQ